VLVRRDIRSIIPQGKVLNVGCGRHGTERAFFPKPHYQIVGVDVSEESLRLLAEKHLYDALYKASIASLPFADESFDIVYLRLVLHHLVYPKNLLASGVEECFRVLKRGGVLALVEPNSWHPVGALMNVAHRLGVDRRIHGTDDDVALSPLALRKILRRFTPEISMHAVTYNWRRLPIRLQRWICQFDAASDRIFPNAPYFGHTLLVISRKP
jgi:SAM-dependent methyltransferase